MVNNYNEIEIKQDWANYFCFVGDKSAIINLNLALKQIGPIPEYKFNIWFSLEVLNPNEDGLVTQEELERIYQIEDVIVDELGKNGAIFMGNLKTNGLFEICFYSKYIENYQEIIDSVMRNYPEYKYSISSKEDSSWNDYFSFLYPEKYEYRSIMNAKVITNLLNSGDNAELEREVDHWFYFKSNQNRELFIKEVSHLGYEVVFQDNLAEDEHPYKLYISHNNNILWDNVDNYVWELVELVEKYEGIYEGWNSNVTKI